MMTGRRADSVSLFHVVIRTLIHWDFILTLLVTAVLAVVLATSSTPLVRPGSIFPAAIATGAGLIAAVVATQRWASDRLKDSHLGQLVRALDVDERRFSLPYQILIANGLLCVLIGLLGVVVGELAPRPWLVVLYVAQFFAVVYGFLGLFSAVAIAQRVQRWYSKMQAEKEAAERIERERKGPGGTPRPPGLIERRSL